MNTTALPLHRDLRAARCDRTARAVDLTFAPRSQTC